eukprot:scaffold301806_cov20-Tisochrysis_lutea.AAC.1
MNRVEVVLADKGFTGELGDQREGEITTVLSVRSAACMQNSTQRIDSLLTNWHAEQGVGCSNNTIAMSNLCRDESCMILEDKIEVRSVFGSCFATHGLGGVLTCGVIGIKAGLSHSPVMGGKEQ